MQRQKVTALALFSGGLDSMLSCRVVAAQGIRVQAIKFVSPFFGYDLLLRKEEYIRSVREKYGLEVVLVDISEKYLGLLRNPAHGFGKNFNPCVDCKILLMSEARKMLDRFGASFLISGEVIGQRPMSQRRDTLRLIERESGCDGLLLRPLCARNLEPTRPELEGLVDRDQLLAFRGRTRTPQMELAEKFGIDDYPSPAGGCTLTDPVLGRRIERFYQEHDEVTVADMRLLMRGRQFRLPGGGMLALGRKEAENGALLELREPGDLVLKMVDRPGPTAILRHVVSREDINHAASLVVRYGKKTPDGLREALVQVAADDGVFEESAMPADDGLLASWRR